MEGGSIQRTDPGREEAAMASRTKQCVLGALFLFSPLGILQQGWKRVGVCFREAVCTSQGARGSAPRPRSPFIGSYDEQLLEGPYPTLYFYLSHQKAPVS